MPKKTRREWTSDEKAQLRRLSAAGLTDGHIAQTMDRDRAQVCRKRHELGIEPGLSPGMLAMMARINMRKRMARAA